MSNTRHFNCRRLFVGSLPLVMLLALQVLPQAQDCVRWVQRTDVGSPGARTGFAMAYDSDRGVTVLFGGNSRDPGTGFILYSDETWEFDGTAWRRSVIDGPSPGPRVLGTACYDTVRHEVVLFGGQAGKNRLKDTWVYHGNEPGHGVWIQKSELKYPFTCDPDDCEARTGHAMVFDSRRGVAVIVGGQTTENNDIGAPPVNRISDVYDWNGEFWSYRNELFPFRGKGSYEGPTGHKMCYDSDTGTISISGGEYYYFLTGKFDDWNDILSAGLFTIRPDGSYYVSEERTPVSGGIGGRVFHAAAYDSDRKRIVIFGGLGGDSASRHDEAVFVPRDDGVPHYSATRLTINTPPGRSGHAMVYDVRRKRIVLFGGTSSEDQITTLSDTWEYGLGAVLYWFVDQGDIPGMLGIPKRDGSLALPFQTVRQGADALDNCPAVLTIQAGDHPEGTLTIDKSVRLEARNGPVHIY